MIILGAPPKDSNDYVGTIYMEGIEFSDVIRWNKRIQMYKGVSGLLYKENDILGWEQD